MPIFPSSQAGSPFTRSLMICVTIRSELILTVCFKSLGIRVPRCFNAIGDH